ncbi:MAG: helix-turn-helix domain-containing protein [Oscillospiraceae bacterium]|nr:helix-turn-helix domain-containing protein [Oscillospiraceae bacterium]
MSKKLSAEEKYNIVKRFINGELSQRHAAELAGVHLSTFQEWIRYYEMEGIDGLTKQKNKSYSTEIRNQAVMDYLSGLGSLAAICKKYKIRAKVQLLRWIQEYNAHGAICAKTKRGGGSYMTQGRKTTKEERVEMVKACLGSGRNYGETALKYGVSYSQIRSWTLRFEELGEAGLEDRRGKRKKDQEPRSELEAAKIEIEKLKHQLYLTEMERDLLKKLDEIERRDAFHK